MTEINFRGKEFVYNHHLSVGHRVLQPDAKKSVGAPDMDGNLIIQGDNLHALKALMPIYAGKVDCVFIDPIYNRGNEGNNGDNGKKGWVYNDNVNAPMIRQWREENPITTDDLLRHDKWCVMMWPRLRLLHELLAETGSFWMTIDDNEAHRAKLMLDEIFGERNFVANVVWQKKFAPQNDAKWLSDNHDHVLVYAKNKESWRPYLLERTDEQNKRYSNPDNDQRGAWVSSDLTRQEFRPNDFYEITSPVTGKKFLPPEGASWGRPKETVEEMIEDNRIWFGEDGNNVPRIKRFLSETKQGITPLTVWLHGVVGHNQEATQELKKIFSGQSQFDTPKPVRLISRILQLALPDDGVVLDSFAGSGTTAHAVLEANKRDGGNRKFILVEMEEHIAGPITAERVRRVIKGYKFQGTQKTELLRKRLNWKELQKARELVAQVDGIEKLESSTYDKIAKQIKNGELIVTGEKKVKEKTEGLGGCFTFCTLGNEMDVDKILTGQDLPDYKALAHILFYTATNQSLKARSIKEEEFYLGKTDTQHIWMLYKPDINWLRSDASALTLSRARQMARKDRRKEHLVFSPALFVSRKVLKEEKLANVAYAPLPPQLFDLYRKPKDDA